MNLIEKQYTTYVQVFYPRTHIERLHNTSLDFKQFEDTVDYVWLDNKTRHYIHLHTSVTAYISYFTR